MEDAPIGTGVTTVSSPLAIGIRNFGGIHYDPAVASPPAAPPAAPGVTAPPAEGSVVVPPATPPAITWDTAPQALRAEYENQKAEAARLKAENEQWQKVGDREQVSQFYGTFSQKLTQATAMGKALGYTDDKIREAMMEDPAKTLAYLQQEYAKPASASHEDLDNRLKSMVEERVKPLQERFDETVNREANARYEGERDRLYKTEFADGLPDENREELFEILDGLIAGDAAALTRLKYQNQTSDVARHMTQAKTIFLKRHNAYIGHERGHGGAPPPKPGAPPNSETGKFSERKLSGKFGGGTVGDFIKNL